MAKRDVVTINSIDKILDNTEKISTVTLSTRNEPIEIKVKRTIPFDKYSDMISDIKNMMFDLKEGKYKSNYNTFAIDYNIIKYFTNIKTDNQAKIFELINKTNIIEQISHLIKPSRETIVADVDCTVDFLKRTIFHASPWDSVAEKIDELLSQMDSMANQINGIDKDTLTRGIELLGSVSKNDLKDIAKDIVMQKANSNG